MNFVEITNLGALSLWSSGGAHAKPLFRWTASDPDAGDVIAGSRVRIYSAAVGGTTLHDSGTLAGNPGSYSPDWYAVNLTSYWVTVEVFDTFGESSGGPSGPTRYEFRVCWGQAIYEYAVPGGSSTSGWAFAAAAMVNSDTHAAFLFRSTATPGSTGVDWHSNISELTPAAYLQVCVRLSTDVAGVDPQLTDMAFTYSGEASQPDYYTFAPTDDWLLDPSGFRYGTKGLKFLVDDNSNDRFIYPYRITPGDDIPVAPNTAYVFSCHVKTDGTLGVGSKVRLEIYSAGGLTSLLAPLVADPLNDGLNEISDSSTGPEGWLRIHTHYTTSPGQTLIRPVIRYINGGAGSGDSGWIDAVQLEEGVVMSPWHANQFSRANVIDGYGLILDAMNGATVRARASDGVTANLDEIVHAAVGGGGGGGGLDFVTVGSGTLISEIVTTP